MPTADDQRPTEPDAAECEIDLRGRFAKDLVDEVCLHTQVLVGAARNLAEGVGLAQPPVPRIWITDDFAGSVSRFMRSGGDEGAADAFTTERLGGEVVGKNLPDPDRPGETVIVLNAPILFGDHDVMNPIMRLFLVAHELFHPLLGRIREEAGLLDGVQFPSITAVERARSIVRTASDEYRCDRLAWMVVSKMVTVNPHGEPPRAANIGDLGTLIHVGTLADVFDQMHPGVADTVQAYRERRLGLGEMWMRVVQFTDQLVTLLAHAQAAWDDAAYESENKVGPLLDLDALREFRANDLYVHDMWTQIDAEIGTVSMLPSVADLAAAEPRLLDVGAEAIDQMWRRLGVRAEPLPDRQDYLHVSAPIR